MKRAAGGPGAKGYMRRPTPSRIVVGLLLCGALGALLVLWLRRDRPGPTGEPGGYFRNAAVEAGLTFRMNFLPDEQGERFKINLYDHGSGVAVGDFDGDGRDDIYFCNQLGPNALYRNRGDGTFEDVTARAGVGLGDRVCVGATFADYDNDDRPDLFVTSTRGGNVLFHNRGDGTFEDVTARAGVAHTGHSQIGIFFDADGDGWLDLLVLQTAKWTTDQFRESGRYYAGKDTFFRTAASEREFNLFYHNNGNGTFTEAGDKAGLRGTGWAGDAAVFDYDGDGRPDVLVTCMFGRAQLYHNRGDGSFEDVTLRVLGRTSWGGMGVKVFDADNDGRLDVFMVDMHSDMWATDRTTAAEVEPSRKYNQILGPLYRPQPAEIAMERQVADLTQVRYDEVLFGNTFFHNRGSGAFQEASDGAGLETFWPWGAAVGDFDNSGHEDVFVPAGMGHPFIYWPNSLLMNNGNGTFTDRAVELGVEPPAEKFFTHDRLPNKLSPRSTRAAAVADFDGDGRLDIVTNNFNDGPYYFRNAFPPKNYVAWRLTGTRSSRDAVGATVTLVLADGVMVRQVHSAGGYLAQSSQALHFGLGDRTEVVRAEVRWPGGRLQTIDRPAINTVHRVTEPRD